MAYLSSSELLVLYCRVVKTSVLRQCSLVARKGKLPVSCARWYTGISLRLIGCLEVGSQCKESGFQIVMLQVCVLSINCSILERISFQGVEVLSGAGRRVE